MSSINPEMPIRQIIEQFPDHKVVKQLGSFFTIV